MNNLSLINSGLIFLSIGIFGFIIPTIKTAKKILKYNTLGNVLPIKPNEKIALIVMPVLGNLFLYLFREETELLDWNYILAIWILTIIIVFFYYLSRTNKYKTGPLTLVLIPSALLTGILLALVMLIHFSPYILMGAMLMSSPLFFLSIFVFPAFGLIQAIILLSTELYSVLKLCKNKVLNREKKGYFINVLTNFYFGKYYLIAQIFTFPIFVTIVQFFFIIFSQEPDGPIQAFIESKDGLFSQGKCENCVSHSSTEYICTIAAFGSTKLVRPLHWGNRQGNIIKVNRQLKVCNAFEEMLAEKMPIAHKHLRKWYDSMQIPIEKWKKVKLIANALYIFIKPLEWIFLVVLYLVDKHPETKIAKQYLPINQKKLDLDDKNERTTKAISNAGLAVKPKFGHKIKPALP
jgi:hypothetical protein